MCFFLSNKNLHVISKVTYTCIKEVITLIKNAKLLVCNFFKLNKNIVIKTNYMAESITHELNLVLHPR